MDLIRPTDAVGAAEALADCSASGRRAVVSGARLHAGRAPAHDAGVVLDSTGLAGIVSYDPAEMVAVVGSGTRVGELEEALAEGGQEWAADAPADATVGGVLAAAVNSPRRLRVGPVRDSLLEVVIATGNGRLIRGGGRVVKNVTGYDLPRLMVGSLGTLGAITQVALKVRPLPKARRTLTFATDDPFLLGERLLQAVPSPAAVIASPGRVRLHLEGWPAEVEAQTQAASRVAQPELSSDGQPLAPEGSWVSSPHRIEAGVAPSRLPELAADAGSDWAALLGVGLLWAGFDLPQDAGSAFALARALGGCAFATSETEKTSETPETTPPLPAPTIHARLKRTFDPAGVLPSLPGASA